MQQKGYENQRNDCPLQHLSALLMKAHALHQHSLTRCQEQRQRSAVAYKIAGVGAGATASFLLLARAPAAAIRSTVAFVAACAGK
jgi:hypothetical protein